jgi:insertion element IS1 protein InsB
MEPEQVSVEILPVQLVSESEASESELDEMWSFVQKKANQRWLWHAIDHTTGVVLA